MDSSINTKTDVPIRIHQNVHYKGNLIRLQRKIVQNPQDNQDAKKNHLDLLMIGGGRNNSFSTDRNIMNTNSHKRSISTQHHPRKFSHTLNFQKKKEQLECNLTWRQGNGLNIFAIQKMNRKLVSGGLRKRNSSFRIKQRNDGIQFHCKPEICLEQQMKEVIVSGRLMGHQIRSIKSKC